MSEGIEEAAMNRYEDDPYVCNCNNVGNRTTGRGTCPCRKASRACTRLCTCGTKKLACKNQPSTSNPRQYWDSDSSSDNDPVYSFIDDSSDDEMPPAQTPQCQEAAKKTKQQKTTSQQHEQTKRKKIRRESAPQETMPDRHDPQDQAQQGPIGMRDDIGQEDIQNEVHEYLNGMEVQELRELCFHLLERHPEEWVRIQENEPGDPDEPVGGEEPEWCHCGNCREMRTEVENVCCRRRVGPCVTSQVHFQNLILDPESLDLAMAQRRLLLLLGDDKPNNNNYRHAGYKNYVFWKEGNPSRYNRVVMPSCAVWAIRNRYPSPDGHYTGFRFHRF